MENHPFKIDSMILIKCFHVQRISQLPIFAETGRDPH
jgi:hypothetical protein